MFMNWKTLIFLLFICFWLHGVFVAMRAFSSFGEQGLIFMWNVNRSLQRLLWFHGTGSGPLAQQLWHMWHMGACSAARGVFPDPQVLNPYPLHWQMVPIDSATRKVPLIFLRMTLFPKLIYRFNAFPIKMPADFFA